MPPSWINIQVSTGYLFQRSDLTIFLLKCFVKKVLKWKQQISFSYNHFFER